MIGKIVQALVMNKHLIVFTLAALVIVAYAVPYGMDVEAKNGQHGNNGKHYGQSHGYGYGLSCDHFKPGKGPVRCR